MKRYDIFVRSLDELEEKKELVKEIRDCSTYQAMEVKAIFSRSAEKLPNGDELVVRALLGHRLDPKPWRIKITEVLKEI